MPSHNLRSPCLVQLFPSWTYWVYSYSCGGDFLGSRPSAAAPRSRRLPFPPGWPSARQTGCGSPLWTERWAWCLFCIAPGQGSVAAETPSFPLAPKKTPWIHCCKGSHPHKSFSLPRVSASTAVVSVVLMARGLTPAKCMPQETKSNYLLFGDSASCVRILLTDTDNKCFVSVSPSSSYDRLAIGK